MYAVAIKYGFLMGLISVIMTLSIYFFDPAMFASISYGVISVVLMLVMLFLFANMARNENGGSFTYTEAFLTLLVMIVVSTVLANLFNYVLYNMIDPNLSELIKKQVIENTSNLLQKMGVQGEELDKALEEIEKQDTSFTAKSMFVSTGGSIAMGAILAALGGLAIKNKRN